MRLLRRWWSWSGLSHHRAGETEKLIQGVLALDVSAVQAALGSPRVDCNAEILPPLVIQPRTLLQHAVLSEHPEMVDCLLTAGADPMRVTDQTFWPAPHLATLLECRPVLERLMAAPTALFDEKVLDPLVGERSSCRDIAARRGRAFTEWFGQFFALTEAARPPTGTPEEAPMFIRKPRLHRRSAHR